MYAIRSYYEIIAFLQGEMGVKKIRFPDHCGIGIKPMSEAGTKRLVRAAMEYAIDNDRDSVTLVHKGNIMNRITSYNVCYTKLLRWNGNAMTIGSARSLLACSGS